MKLVGPISQTNLELMNFRYFCFTGKHFRCTHVTYCHKIMIKKVHKILKLKFERFSHNQVQGKVDYYQAFLILSLLNVCQFLQLSYNIVKLKTYLEI